MEWFSRICYFGKNALECRYIGNNIWALKWHLTCKYFKVNWMKCNFKTQSIRWALPDHQGQKLPPPSWLLHWEEDLLFCGRTKPGSSFRFHHWDCFQICRIRPKRTFPWILDQVEIWNGPEKIWKLPVFTEHKEKII